MLGLAQDPVPQGSQVQILSTPPEAAVLLISLIHQNRFSRNTLIQDEEYRLSVKTTKHKDLVDFLFTHPEEIEKGFRSTFKEFSIGRGRVDIVGVDKDRNLCVVEVKTKAASLEDELQVRHYRSGFISLFKMLCIDRAVRAIVVTPNQTKDLGKTRGFDRAYVPKIIPNDLPTSRQLFGLKQHIDPLNQNLLFNMAQTPERSYMNESLKLDSNRYAFCGLQFLEDIEAHPSPT